MSQLDRVQEIEDDLVHLGVSEADAVRLRPRACPAHPVQVAHVILIRLQQLPRCFRFLSIDSRAPAITSSVTTSSEARIENSCRMYGNGAPWRVTHRRGTNAPDLFLSGVISILLIPVFVLRVFQFPRRPRRRRRAGSPASQPKSQRTRQHPPIPIRPQRRNRGKAGGEAHTRPQQREGCNGTDWTCRQARQ